MPKHIIPNTPKQLSLFDQLKQLPKEPLPILVSQKWDFLLQRYETDSGNYYAVQDWIAGIGTTSPQLAAQAWTRLKSQLLISNQQLKIDQMDYLATNGKTYQMDFADDKTLYLIAQEMRVTTKRPALQAIKQYLADAGAFVDELRTHDELPPLSKKLRKLHREKDLLEKAWSENEYAIERAQLKIDVIESFNALQNAVRDIVENPNYGRLTNTEYRALFNATASELKEQLKTKHIRDELGNMALSTLRHAETMLMNILRKAGKQLSMEQTQAIYQDVLTPIGKSHGSICEQFGFNPLSDKPLLPSGE